MAHSEKKPEGGLHISGNVSVNHGDFVAGDKNAVSGQGNVIATGGQQDADITTGGRQDGVEAEKLFAQLLERIDGRPNTSVEDKADLKASVAEIRAEAGKDAEADEGFVARRIRNIQRIAPDIADVVLSTIANPAAGLAMVAKKIAERAQKAGEA